MRTVFPSIVPVRRAVSFHRFHPAKLPGHFFSGHRTRPFSPDTFARVHSLEHFPGRFSPLLASNFPGAVLPDQCRWGTFLGQFLRGSFTGDIFPDQSFSPTNHFPCLISSTISPMRFTVVARDFRSERILIGPKFRALSPFASPSRRQIVITTAVSGSTERRMFQQMFEQSRGNDVSRIYLLRFLLSVRLSTYSSLVGSIMSCN